MLEKIKKLWCEWRIAIVAAALAVVYFFGLKKGRDNEKAKQNTKILAGVESANNARARLDNNSHSVRRLHKKYKR